MIYMLFNQVNTIMLVSLFVPNFDARCSYQQVKIFELSGSSDIVLKSL